MKVFLRFTILALFFLTNVIYAADSKSNRKDNVVSFGVKGGVGWPAITSPIFIAIPGEKWSVGLDYGSKKPIHKFSTYWFIIFLQFRCLFLF